MKKQLPSKGTNPRPESDRRLRQADRLARVLRMLQMLLSRGRWNVRDIATEQECSERTVFRDMQVLALAGIPVEFDQMDRCYRVRQDFRFPSFGITEEEAIGQGTAAVITTGPGLDINLGARPVTQKLAATLKTEVAQILADTIELVAVIDLKLADHHQHRDTIRTIQSALVRRKLLEGVYRSPYETQDVGLQLHPYRLALIKAAWYLIARPTNEESPRTYRVTRFKLLKMTDRIAQVPEDFDLKAYLGNAWAVYRGNQSHEVKIHFQKEAAATVIETIWHHTQEVHRNKDGSVILTFRVDGLNEILSWLLGWAGRAKVLKPPKLQQLLVEQHRKAIKMNEK